MGKIGEKKQQKFHNCDAGAVKLLVLSPQFLPFDQIGMPSM
jgi:hypothetical protein